MSLDPTAKLSLRASSITPYTDWVVDSGAAGQLFVEAVEKALFFQNVM